MELNVEKMGPSKNAGYLPLKKMKNEHVVRYGLFIINYILPVGV